MLHCQECVVQNACLVFKDGTPPFVGFKYVWNVMIGIAVVVVRQMEMVERQKYTCEINSVF